MHTWVILTQHTRTVEIPADFSKSQLPTYSRGSLRSRRPVHSLCGLEGPSTPGARDKGTGHSVSYTPTPPPGPISSATPGIPRTRIRGPEVREATRWKCRVANVVVEEHVPLFIERPLVHAKVDRWPRDLPVHQHHDRWCSRLGSRARQTGAGLARPAEACRIARRPTRVRRFRVGEE